MRLERTKLPCGAFLHHIEAGSGPAVVLLHGGMGDCLSWEHQLAALAADFHVVSYSRRYHYPNRNPPQGPHRSCAHEARDLGAFLHALQLGPVHLVGTSYGALVALTYALGQPEEVLSLVLAEPPLARWVRRTSEGLPIYQTFMRTVWRPAARAFNQDMPLLAMRVLYDGMRGQGRFDALAPAELERIMRNAGAMRMLVCSRNAFAHVDPGMLGRSALPFLLLTGQHTVPIHRLAHELLATALPAARNVVVPGAGHAAANENPTRFNSELLAFLRQTSARHRSASKTE